LLTMHIITNSPEDTIRQGRLLGEKLKGGTFIGLYGVLGAGKTMFVKGVAEGLAIKENITSPSFVILKIYKGRFTLYHIDLYRILNSEEEEEMLNEYIDSDGICIVEWAERLRSLLPKNRIDVKFKIIDEHTREIDIEYIGS